MSSKVESPIPLKLPSAKGMSTNKLSQVYKPEYPMES